jgi:hypothetical protein
MDEVGLEVFFFFLFFLTYFLHIRTKSLNEEVHLIIGEAAD